MSRILTKSEITDCVPSNRWIPKYEDILNICKAQDAKTTKVIIEIINKWTDDEHAKSLRVLIENNVR